MVKFLKEALATAVVVVVTVALIESTIGVRRLDVPAWFKRA